MKTNEIIFLLRTAIKNTKFAGKTYLVGGYVRDLVMGNENADIDLAVALPDGGLELAKFLHEKKISSRPVTYDNFGTALVDINGSKVEFVMTRKESYRATDRKPDVECGNLKDDVFRRDFTINSLLIDVMTDEIIDLSGRGLADIKNGIIRSTSNPDLIFSEDPLRMLRAVRFSARFDFDIENNTSAGIRNNCDMLQYISWERRRDELIKMLSDPNAVTALQMLIDLNLMRYLIPELLDLVGLEQGYQHDEDAWLHSLKVVANIHPDMKLRLIALLHDVGKSLAKSENETGIHFYRHEIIGAELAKRILKRLKFSKELITEAVFVIRNHMRLKRAGKQGESISDKAIRRLLISSGTALESLLELVHADNISHAVDHCLPDQIPHLKIRLASLREELKKKSLPISGKDIIDYYNLVPGKEVGKLLDKATEEWLENPGMCKKEILMKLKRRVIMENKESKITLKVKDGVIKAFHAGEDIVKAVGNITKEIITTTKDEELNTKEKAQKLAKDALDGAKDGYTQVKPGVEDFAKKAAEKISETFKVYAPKIAHFTKDVFDGIVDGTKEVIDESKKKKSCCKNCEDEEEK